MRDDRLFLEVPVASRYVVRILEHRLESTGIPPYQLGLLTHIRHAQPVTPTEISTASGVPLTTLRDNIQRLVDGQPAPYSGETIVVGALDTYEARCRDCHQAGPDAVQLVA